MGKDTGSKGRVVEDAETLGTGAGITLTGGLAAQALTMLGYVLIARLLGAANFGLYSIGWTLVRVLPSLTNLGLEAGVMYIGARYLSMSPARFKGAVKQSITMALFSGLATGIAIYLAAPALAEHVFHKPEASQLIRAFGPMFPIYAVIFVAGAATKLSHRMQYLVYAHIVAAASALLFFCILFELGFGLMGAVFSSVGGMAVGALMTVCFVAVLFPEVFSKETKSEWVAGELLGYSLPLMVSGLAASTLTFIDRLFVGSYCTSAETGIYFAASQLSLLFAIICGSFFGIFSPMVANLHARGERERLVELYRVCAKWAFYASAPVFLVVFSAPVQLLQFVYGSAYTKAAAPLMILAAGQVFMATTAASGPVLLMTGRQNIFLLAALVALPIDVALNYLLVPKFGLSGAATAAAVSNVVLNTITVIAVRTYVGIQPFDRRCVKGLVALLGALGILYILRPLEIGAPAIRLSIIAGTSLGAFTGCLFALGLDAEDREILRMLWARVRWLAQPLRPAYRS